MKKYFCVHCGNMLDVKDNNAGTEIHCSSCNQITSIPIKKSKKKEEPESSSKRESICPYCNGSGSMLGGWGAGSRQCPACVGKGRS